jgi:peptidoglycan/xylan/chitin deacetylase (PgdA/CDA1 family)
VLSLIFFALWWPWHRLACLCGLGRARLVILYYHAVPLAMRARFARQLDILGASAEAVVPPDFQGNAPPGQLLVAITFDDAFVSVVENAVPELAARGMAATLFAPSGQLARHPEWYMETTAEDRFESVASAELLKNLPPFLTVGAHSITHPFLPEIDCERAAMEIVGSRADLKRITGRDVVTFSFPYGEYDDHVVELCRSAGYRFAYTTAPAMVDPADTSFLRGRVLVELDDSPLEFWLKMQGAYSWRAPLRYLKRRLWPRPARQGEADRSSESSRPGGDS